MTVPGGQSRPPPRDRPRQYKFDGHLGHTGANQSPVAISTYRHADTYQIADKHGNNVDHRDDLETHLPVQQRNVLNRGTRQHEGKRKHKRNSYQSGFAKEPRDRRCRRSDQHRNRTTYDDVNPEQI